jgi:hypothetical protein
MSEVETGWRTINGVPVYLGDKVGAAAGGAAGGGSDTKGGSAAPAAGGDRAAKVAKFEQEHKEWKQSVSPQQKDAINNWCETDYKRMRDMQAGKTKPEDDPKTAEQLDHMLKALDAAPTINETIHRGMKNLKKGDIEALTTEGNEVKFDTISSWRRDADVAHTIATQNKDRSLIKAPQKSITMEVETDGSVRVDDFSNYKSEAENVLKQGRSFKVQSVEERTAFDQAGEGSLNALRNHGVSADVIHKIDSPEAIHKALLAHKQSLIESPAKLEEAVQKQLKSGYTKWSGQQTLDLIESQAKYALNAKVVAKFKHVKLKEVRNG